MACDNGQGAGRRLNTTSFKMGLDVKGQRPLLATVRTATLRPSGPERKFPIQKWLFQWESLEGLRAVFSVLSSGRGFLSSILSTVWLRPPISTGTLFDCRDWEWNTGNGDHWEYCSVVCDEPGLIDLNLIKLCFMDYLKCTVVKKILKSIYAQQVRTNKKR